MTIRTNPSVRPHVCLMRCGSITLKRAVTPMDRHATCLMPTDYKQMFALPRPDTRVRALDRGYPPIRLVWSRTSQSWLPPTTVRPPGRSQRTELQVWLGHGPLRGRAEQSVEEHTPCFHRLDTGWFMLTAENDFGELEEYFVLCRKCTEA